MIFSVGVPYLTPIAVLPLLWTGCSPAFFGLIGGEVTAMMVLPLDADTSVIAVIAIASVIAIANTKTIRGNTHG